jgi:dUTP pyrophosphatase
MSKEALRLLIAKTKSQQERWKRISNQTVEQLIEALERKSSMINIDLLSIHAQIPTRGSKESAGLDLYTIDSVTIPPGQRALLRTGFAMSMPIGYVGLIWPRSKLALRPCRD